MKASIDWPVRAIGRNLILSIVVSQSMLGICWAQSGPAPSYIDELQPFQVRELSGNYAPVNGNISMRDITPAEWLTNDPATLGLSGVIIAWNGGAKTSNSQLIVHGGGHNDSANNGVYVFEFGGNANPEGWDASMTISDVSSVQPNGATYADGKPVSVHTYDGVVHASHNGYIYRFAGSRYQNGFFSPATFKYNIATKTWQRGPDYPSQAGGAKTFYDPASGNIFVTMNDTFNGYFYRTSNDTWSSSKSYGGADGFPFDSIAAWDTRRSRGIIVGDDERSLLNIDFAAETLSVSEFSPSGDTSIFGRLGISAVYDPMLDVYWLFGGDTGSPGWDTIYEMNADGPPWTVRAHSLSGARIERLSGMWGSWGRFAFMAGWRAIGLVASHTSPVYVVKLPGSLADVPKPPTQLVTD